MKETFVPGLTHQFEFKVPTSKTVPKLYPESPEFSEMPEIFATGYMVGLFEWTCMQLMSPHLDEGEGSVGVNIDVTHSAATPPGMIITVDVQCIEVRGPRAKFMITAHDGLEEIGKGHHERFIVKWERFNRRLLQKSEQAA